MQRPHNDRPGSDTAGRTTRLACLTFSLAALLLYGVSLWLPAILTNQERAVPVPGFMAVLFGTVALFGLSPAVLANPAILTGCVLLACRRPRAAAVAGGLAVAFTLSTLLIYDPAAPPVRTGNHASLSMTGPVVITRLEAGYYCWLASAAVLSVGSIAGLRATRASPDTGTASAAAGRRTAESR